MTACADFACQRYQDIECYCSVKARGMKLWRQSPPDRVVIRLLTLSGFAVPSFSHEASRSSSESKIRQLAQACCNVPGKDLGTRNGLCSDQ
jgi:hypothetical protein